jgi:ribonuclease R
MSKAVYDPHCRGHFGLAESEYLHFTSPIRRYPDLIVHRMLRKYFFEEDFTSRKKDEAAVREYAETSSERERAADDAEYQCDDMKRAEYMSQHIGEKFTGIISSVKGFGFYVTLPNTVEGMVRVESLYDGYYRYDEARMALINERAHVMYRVGDTIDVQCIAASKAARTVEFGVIRESGGRMREGTVKSSGKHKTRSRSARKAELYGYDSSRSRGGRKKGKKSNGRRKK